MRRSLKKVNSRTLLLPITYSLLRWTPVYLFELLPMTAILYYELGSNGFSASFFFRYVQEYIETYMKGNAAAGSGQYLVRGCFVIGIFYLSQRRGEEAKLFLM